MKKRCTKCHRWQDVSNFYHDRSKNDGLKTYCIACEQAYKAEVKAKNEAARLLENKQRYHGDLLSIPGEVDE